MNDRFRQGVARAAPWGIAARGRSAEEDGVEPERETETFAELVLALDNARWAGTHRSYSAPASR